MQLNPKYKIHQNAMLNLYYDYSDGWLDINTYRKWLGYVSYIVEF